MDMKTSEKVHKIGHGLKDTKLTINRDLDLDVAGIHITGKQGEVVNVPRWAGQILKDGGLGELDGPNMVTELKQALSKEKMVGEYQVSTLEPNFYIKLKASMKKMDQLDFDKMESIMMELFRMRRGKLIKLADSSKLTSELNSKLTVEEKVFFESIGSISNAFEQQIKGDSDE